MNYAAAVGLSVVFALFLSGRIGWFFVSAFVCAPLISVLMTLLFVKRISAEAQISASAVCKGECCELTVTLTNDFFLPSPPVIVEMFSCARAVCSDKGAAVSLMPYSAESFDVKYTALICGHCEIGASKVELRDYFGLFSFTPKCVELEMLRAGLDIIPDIAEIKPDDPIVSDTADLIAAADDSEDTTEKTGLKFGGFPGYESRDYVPGDPLKRINWKQSVKRNRLLVRQDDEAASPSVAIVLDRCLLRSEADKPSLFKSKALEYCTDDNIFETAEQYAVEGALGLIRSFFVSGYSVNFLLCGKNGWQVYSANDENELAVIQTELASYRFSCDRELSRFPGEELHNMKGSVSVFCTPYADSFLKEQLSPYSGRDGKEELKAIVFAAAGLGGEP